MLKILLAGGTGVVGTEVLQQSRARGDHVIAVGRRPTGLAHEELLTDFDALPQLPDADIAICALGTTIGKAGSREAFRAVDHGAVLAFAKAAQAAGVEHFMVVTAVGAERRDPARSLRPGFRTTRHPAAGSFARRKGGEAACRERIESTRPDRRSTDDRQLAPVSQYIPRGSGPVSPRIGQRERARRIHSSVRGDAKLTESSLTAVCQLRVTPTPLKCGT